MYNLNNLNINRLKIFSFPNMISISRIVLSPLMYYLWENKLMLFSLIVVIGFTDIFDGYIARKLRKQTILGAWLDSIADFVFFVAFIVFAVIFDTEHVVELKYFIVMIVMIKMVSAITGLIKFKRPGFLHTIGNKITVIIIIIGLCIFVLFQNALIVKIGLYISILSASEEFMILLIGNKYEPNMKGIWELRKIRLKTAKHTE